MKCEGKCGGRERRSKRCVQINPIVRMNYCIWILNQRLLPLHFCVCTFMGQTRPTASLRLTFPHVFRDAMKSFAQKEEKCHSQFRIVSTTVWMSFNCSQRKTQSFATRQLRNYGNTKQKHPHRCRLFLNRLWGCLRTRVCTISCTWSSQRLHCIIVNKGLAMIS